MRELIACIVLVCCTGCIGLFRGSTQGVWLISDPPGAKVTFGEQSGVTPCVVAIERGDAPMLVRYELEGRVTAERMIAPTTDGGLLVLSFLNFPLSLFGDLVMGSARSWPHGITAHMAPAGQSSTIDETRELPRTPGQIKRDQEEEDARARRRSYAP